jgi:hypothetical protein
MIWYLHPQIVFENINNFLLFRSGAWRTPWYNFSDIRRIGNNICDVYATCVFWILVVYWSF